MKFALAILLLALGYSAAAQPFPTNVVVKPKQSVSVTLAWDPSPATNVAGYLLYAGVSSGIYNVTFPTTNTSFTVTNLAAGVTYFFAVTARTAGGLESDYSAEVSHTEPKPAAPAAPAIRKLEVSAVLQSAPDPLGPWQTVFGFPTNWILADASRQFYRVKGIVR